MSHILAEDFVLERLDDDLAWSRAMVQQLMARAAEESVSLTFLAAQAHELAALLVLAGRASDPECGNMAWLAGHAEAFALYLALFPKGEQELEVMLPNPPHDLLSIGRITTGPTSASTPGHWLKAFYLTLLWDEPVIMNETLMRSYASVFPASSTRAPAYRTLQVEAAQALYRRAPDLLEQILIALDAMQAPDLPSEDQAFATDIAMCEAGMMYRLALGDEAGFNKEVSLALERHVKYYRRDEEFRHRPVAWVCLPALGLAALARRRGLNVSVQSPLLPLDLLA